MWMTVHDRRRGFGGIIIRNIMDHRRGDGNAQVSQRDLICIPFVSTAAINQLTAETCIKDPRVP